MPRKPALSEDVIVQCFQKFKNDILDANGKILPPSNPIWKQISDSVECVCSPKYLYTLIKMNR